MLIGRHPPPPKGKIVSPLFGDELFDGGRLWSDKSAPSAAS